VSEPQSTFVGLRRTVPLLMLVVACGHFNRVGISVIGSERLIPEQGISPERMGLVYSAFLLFYTVAMLPGGWFIDRFGARTALMLWGFGSVVFVGLSACTTFVGSDNVSLWLSLLVVRAMLGVVNAPLHPASARMISEQVGPRSRVLANGLVTFGACAGIASTYSVMGTLVDRFGWPWALGICSAMTLVVSLIWTAGTRPVTRMNSIHAPSSKSHVSLTELMPILLQRSVICITLSYTALGYFQYLFFYWIGYFFETIQHQDRSVARGYATIITGAMGVGMVCGGWLADRVPHSFNPWLRRALVPVLGMIGSGVVFEIGLLTADPQITFASLAVSAFLIGASEGSFWTTSVELGGRFGGTTASFMNTGCNLGGTLSPFLTPMLSQFFAQYYGEDAGWRISLAAAGIMVIFGATLWWGIHPEAKYAVGLTEQNPTA
jgi:MFS transporter, ACS family, D-galactonate transporter